MHEKKEAVTVTIVLASLLAISTFLVFPVWATKDSWVTLEPMPTARSNLGVVAVNGKIYAIGGYNGSYLAVNEMYDPQTNTWTIMAPMPLPRSSFGICVHHDKIYVFGGIFRDNYGTRSSYTNITEVYDPSTDSWSTGASEPTAGRAHFCANVVGDEIYLVSGSSYTLIPPSFSQSSDSNLVYNPTTDSWSTRTSIPISISSYPSVVVDNKIYFIGSDPVFVIPPQTFDPKTDTWNSGTGITTAIYNPAGGATRGKMAPVRIYVFGGMYNGSANAGDITYVYDPKNDTWTTGAPMPTPRDGAQVAVVNDELYVIGGKNQTTFFATNEKYTPADFIPEFSSWTILPLTVAVALVITVYRKKYANHQHQN